MVQGDQFSELSRFLLGNNLVRSGKHGPAAAAAAVGGALPLLLPGSTGASPGQLQPLARVRGSAWGGLVRGVRGEVFHGCSESTWAWGREPGRN